MIEITNMQRTPVQIPVRSKDAPNEFTVLNIPGIGAGKNIRIIEDERRTEYISRIENWKMISTRIVQDK